MPNSIYHDLRNLAYKAHIFELAVAPYEQSGEQSRPYATTKYVNKIILQHLPALPTNYKRRLKNTRTYNKELANNGNFTILAPIEQPLLAYPILFPTTAAATEVYDVLTSSKFHIRRWYSPLLYPGPTSNRRYSYSPKMAPTAEDIHSRVLCLPTDLSPERMKTILSIIKPVKNPVEKIIKSQK